jgi:hypothetical protein
VPPDESGMVVLCDRDTNESTVLLVASIQKSTNKRDGDNRKNVNLSPLT